MRGLKPKNEHGYETLRKVASFTDAWIETYFVVFEMINLLSHLLQMRGLKLLFDQMMFLRTKFVASFTDAWIETPVVTVLSAAVGVASFTDAWIETCATLTLTRQQSRIFYRCVD